MWGRFQLEDLAAKGLTRAGVVRITVVVDPAQLHLNTNMLCHRIDVVTALTELLRVERTSNCTS